MQTVLKLKYWLLTVIFIVLVSIFGRKLQFFIMARISQSTIAIIVFLFLIFLLLFLWKKKTKYQLSEKMLGIACVMLLLAGSAVYLKLLYPIEAVHFLVFSWFGWISTVVFGPFYGAAAIFSMGVGDEILQHFLPSRVGDLHDVLINLISGYTGLILRLRW